MISCVFTDIVRFTPPWISQQQLVFKVTRECQTRKHNQELRSLQCGWLLVSPVNTKMFIQELVKVIYFDD